MSSEPIDAKLTAARDRRDEIAKKYQRSRRNFAIFAAALSPLAVALLSLQALALRDAIWLIGGEVLLLAIALGMGFLELTRSHLAWISDRLRAELLRREGFLLAARVGPYLTKETPSERDVELRMMQLDNDGVRPEHLVPLRDEDGKSWRDALEDARHGNTVSSAAPSGLTACAANYLDKRVCDQRDWFLRKSQSHAQTARWLENGAKIALLLAVVVATLHLGVLIESPNVDGPLHQILEVVAICLPPIGAALVAFLAILGSQRLSRSYHFSSITLNGIAKQLQELLADLETVAAPTADQVHAFKRLVIQAEEVVSDDLVRWWVIMRSEAPRAGA